MDLRTVLASALLLVVSEAAHVSSTSVTFPSTQTSDNTTKGCVCCEPGTPPTPAAPGPTPTRPVPVLGVLAVHWTGACVGALMLHHGSSTSHVCYATELNLNLTLFQHSCENRKGCAGKPKRNRGGEVHDGYRLSDRGAEQSTSSCTTLRIRCADDVLPNVQGQLQAYKVMTALLLCVLLLLLLIRFYRPTVKALQKRLSDRRQNRWIGPTQSHSVSYHRGKTMMKGEGEKRLSYPALERLAISDSREPSSNRNSDYNL